MCFCGGQGGRGGHKVPTISGVSLFSMTCVMCVARANGREGVRREEINPPAEKKKKKKNHTRTYFRIEIQGEREGAGGGREERRGDWGGGCLEIGMQKGMEGTNGSAWGVSLRFERQTDHVAPRVFVSSGIINE